MPGNRFQCRGGDLGECLRPQNVTRWAGRASFEWYARCSFAFGGMARRWARSRRHPRECGRFISSRVPSIINTERCCNLFLHVTAWDIIVQRQLILVSMRYDRLTSVRPSNDWRSCASSPRPLSAALGGFGGFGLIQLLGLLLCGLLRSFRSVFRSENRTEWLHRRWRQCSNRPGSRSSWPWCPSRSTTGYGKVPSL